VISLRNDVHFKKMPSVVEILFYTSLWLSEGGKASATYSPPLIPVDACFHALANPIAFPDRCSAAWRNPGRSLGAIADQLSMVCQVLRELEFQFNFLLLHKL
jgi:hypothetical protein